MHAEYLAYLAALAASIQRCVAALLAAGRGARGTWSTEKRIEWTKMWQGQHLPNHRTSVHAEKLQFFQKTSGFLLRKNKVNGFSFAYVACHHGSLAMLILHRISAYQWFFPEIRVVQNLLNLRPPRCGEDRASTFSLMLGPGQAFHIDCLELRGSSDQIVLKLPTSSVKIRDQLTWRWQWKMDPLIDWVDVFPIEKGGDIPASYVSLPEGIWMFPKIVVPPNHQF